MFKPLKERASISRPSWGLNMVEARPENTITEGLQHVQAPRAVIG